MPLSLVEEEVERLVENEFVGRLQEPQGVSLIKSPDLIFVKKFWIRFAMEPAVDSAHLDTSDPVAALLHRRDKAVERALVGETVQSLLQDQPPSSHPLSL